MRAVTHAIAVLLAACSAPTPKPTTAGDAHDAVEVEPLPAASGPAEPHPPAAPDPAPSAGPGDEQVDVKAIDDPAADQVLKAQLDAIRGCYRETLAKDRSAHAVWACFFVRDASGRVTGVDIPGDPLPALRVCIIDVVKRAKFGPPVTPNQEQTFFVAMGEPGPW